LKIAIRSEKKIRIPIFPEKSLPDFCTKIAIRLQIDNKSQIYLSFFMPEPSAHAQFNMINNEKFP